MATLTGTNNNDKITLTSGVDVVAGLGGADTIEAGAFFTALDAIDGGSGADVLVLDGDYAQMVVMNAATLSGMETIQLRSGHDYSLKTHDGTLAKDMTLKVAFTGDPALGGRLIFDGSAETNGMFELNGGAGNDILKGGSGWFDTFTIGAGTDVVFGNGGDDTVIGGANVTKADKFFGGDGHDAIQFDGDYGQTLAFMSNSLNDIEYLHISSGHDYAFKMHDANVAAGEQLSVSMQGGTAGRVLFDGSAEMDGQFGVTGASGNDVIKGGAGDDTFWVWDGGVDAVYGGGGDDYIMFRNSYTTADKVFGGAGHDTLVLGGGLAEDIYFDPATISSVEEIAIESEDGGVTVLTTFDGMVGAGATMKVGFNGAVENPVQTLAFNGGAETDGAFDIRGGQGDDIIITGAGDDFIDIGAGGDDAVAAGGGDDEVEAERDFGSSDFIDGGAGRDRLTIGEIQNGFVTFSGANVKGFEAVYFVDSLQETRSVTSTDAFLAAGQTLYVNAGYLTGSDERIVWDGGAEKDGSFSFTGAGGADVFVGGAKDDQFDLRAGGADQAIGGQGKDSFSFAGAMTSGARVDGGADDDSVAIYGDYSAGIVFNNLTMRNVEYLSLSAGSSYNLTLHEGTIAAGAELVVGAHWLKATDWIKIDDRAETAGGLDVRAGQTFLNAGTSVRGGAGGEDSVDIDGDYSAGVVFGATTLTGVEHLTLGSGHSYTLKSHNDTVAAGKSLEVRGYWLEAGDSLVFDGTAETDGKFVISGGAGDDMLKGGASGDRISIDTGGIDLVQAGGGDDYIVVGSALTAADQINGGAGLDEIEMSGDVTLTLGGSAVADIEKLFLRSGHDYTLNLSDALLDAGETLVVSATGLGSGDVLIVRGTAETNGALNVKSGAGADSIIGGAMADTLVSYAGADTLKGGGGADLLEGGADNDRLYGQAHSDTLKGGDGDDLLYGGVASDVFVFSGAAWGKDRIVDYELHLDKIDLRNNGMAFGDIDISYLNGDAIISSQHGSILLDNVSGGLVSADFMF
jgi:Ca2+-binding RTX toxin-like protein